MFTVYYSNLLEVQKEILLHLMTREPLEDPLQSEVILVQSP
ncbi:exonuclease V subunit gamma, partial [Avibacterium paragallinarum]